MNGRGTVLIVDDTPESLRVLTEILQLEGYTVRPANSGKLALTSIAAQPPDLILLDIRMPGLDGFEVCRRLKADEATRNIPVIFQSAATDMSDRLEGLRLGAVDYISKPFQREELLARVKTHLELALLRGQLAVLVKERTAQLELEISERKRAESEMRHLAQIVESSDDAIIGKSLDGTILTWNRGAEATYGYTAAEAKGRHTSMLVAPESADDIMAIIERIRRGEHVECSETMRMRKDGTRIFVSLTVSPVKDEAGVIVGASAIERDITAKKAAEQEIQRAMAYNRSLIEASLDPLVTIGPDGTITDVNAATESATGRPRAELVGTDFSECFTEPGKARDGYRRVFVEGAVRDYPLEIRRRSGGVTPVLYNASLYRNGAGAIVGVVAAARDITAQRKLEEQLRQAQKMEAIGVLAGGVAHDFNNILTAIIGYGTLAKMKLPPADAVQGHIDQILVSSERATHLTQGLLAFSRKQVISPKPLDLNDVVRRLEKLLCRLIGEDIELRIRLDKRDLIAMADAGQIEQVLMNLVTNARDAMPTGGVLTIGSEHLDIGEDFVAAHGVGPPGEYAMLTVSDTGVGMDEKTREKIFEPFYTTKGLGKGTGLGLSIVYGIVKQHGGTINVYSEPGKGTQFKIYLPLEARSTPERPALAAGPPRGGNETILIAEDDREVRNLVATVLRAFGYRVLEATDGQEALELFVQHADAIDLLLVDVIMPKQSGKEVYDAVVARKPNAKILLVSGYTADVIHQKGIADEGVDFLSKPLSPHELLRKIRTMLDEEAAIRREATRAIPG